MQDSFLSSLSLIDVSGYVIIAAIIILLIIGIIVIFSVRARYGLIARELRRRSDPSLGFRQRVLDRIMRETEDAFRRRPGEINTQAIIEIHFQRYLKGSLIGERFVKSLTGLLIILGLVGTFYGLTLSIGKLVTLVSGDVTGVTEITQSLTKGLTQALAGMSVAFSTSLFGILAAIVMTLLGVFFNLADSRTAVMVQIEAYIDNNLLPTTRDAFGTAADSMGALPPPPELGDPGLGQVVLRFGQSVASLEQIVTQFDSALGTFSENTRDFQEFNAHLKDNIQRMSLSFSDLSNTLKAHLTGLKSPGGR
jgi:hypothetical protein